MEDVWIARHTKARYLGTMGAPITVPGNPRRFGFLVSRGYRFQFDDVSGQNVVTQAGPSDYGGLAGTITTQVPPGVDTISANPTVTSNPLQPYYFTILNIGPAIMSGGTIAAIDGNGAVWEVEGDETFERAYSRFDEGRR